MRDLNVHRILRVSRHRLLVSRASVAANRHCLKHNYHISSKQSFAGIRNACSENALRVILVLEETQVDLCAKNGEASAEIVPVIVNMLSGAAG